MGDTSDCKFNQLESKYKVSRTLSGIYNMDVVFRIGFLKFRLSTMALLLGHIFDVLSSGYICWFVLVSLFAKKVICDI